MESGLYSTTTSTIQKGEWETVKTRKKVDRDYFRVNFGLFLKNLCIRNLQLKKFNYFFFNWKL